jgi:hypothetical protein
LDVTDQATRVENEETTIPVTVAFPPTNQDNVYAFDESIPAKPGFKILAARYEEISARGAENLDLRAASDGRSAHLTGKLTKQSARFGRKSALPNLLVHVVLTQEYRVPASRPTVPVTAAIAPPGSVLLPLPALPANWVDPQRDVRLEMRDGDRVLWDDSRLPRHAALKIKDRPYSLTAILRGDQVRVELAEVNSAALSPVGN